MVRGKEQRVQQLGVKYDGLMMIEIRTFVYLCLLNLFKDTKPMVSLQVNLSSNLNLKVNRGKDPLHMSYIREVYQDRYLQDMNTKFMSGAVK